MQTNNNMKTSQDALSVLRNIEATQQERNDKALNQCLNGFAVTLSRDEIVQLLGAKDDSVEFWNTLLNSATATTAKAIMTLCKATRKAQTLDNQIVEVMQ